jgi:hypothetical protein
MPYCPNCGTQNLEAAKFCVSCGTPLPSGSTAQAPVQPSSPSFPPVQTLGVGSKVSFAASDGKTYTGTIKDIQGDQYKIKYDAFDFETWLGTSQFTVIEATGTTPVYSAPPIYTAPPISVNPQATYTNPATTATTTSAPGMAIITHLGFWGSLIILIGFFTNWINAGYLAGQNVSGFTFIRYAGEILDSSNNEAPMFMLIAIAVIVISAVICLLYILGVGIGRGAFAVFKILPLLAMIGFIVYSVIKAKDGGGDYETDTGMSPWKILGIGIYLTLAGSIVLAIAKGRR